MSVDEMGDEINRLKFVLHYWRELARRLLDALRVYAAHENWRTVYDDGEQVRRMWVGPGEGPALAETAVQGADRDLDGIE